MPECTSSSSLPDPVGAIEGALALDPLGQLWGALATNGVVAVDLSSEAATHQFAGPRLNAIVASSTHVFGLTLNGTSVLSWLVSAPDGTQPFEIETDGTPSALALDGRSLFVGEAEGNLFQVLIGDAGELQSRLVARLGGGIQGLAVTADRIYVAADGRIGWVER